MNFQYPALLLAIPLLILLALVFRWRNRSSLEKKRFPFFVVSISFVLIALSNPYWKNVPAKEKVKGADLVLITDVSQSMFCSVGGKATRVDLARKFIKSLIPSFTGSQVALIYFSGDAQIGAPFTTDLHAISLLIDSIAPGMSAQAGTRTESLEETLNQLLRKGTTGKLPVILFFSDGEFFDSGRSFQSYVKGKNLRMFTFLCGVQKAPVLNYDLSAPVPGAFSTPNETSLRRLAQAGNAEFLNLSRERTTTIFQKLNSKIEELIIEGQSVPDYRPVPFLIMALLFLLLYQWFPFNHANLRPGLALVVLFLASSVSMKPEDSRKTFQEALIAVRKGDQEKALKKVKSLPAEFYPAQKDILMGNISYKAGKYDEAIQYYQKVLEQDPLNETARWNWEVTLKRRSDQTGRPPRPKQRPAPQIIPENRNALLQYVDQLEKEQRQKSNRANMGKSEFAW